MGSLRGKEGQHLDQETCPLRLSVPFAVVTVELPCNCITLSIVTFSAILQLRRDLPVVSGGGNLSTQCKPLLNPESLATFSHARDGIPTWAVVRDSGNFLDHTAIRTGCLIVPHYTLHSELTETISNTVKTFNT